MLYIHGGQFMRGSNSTDFYGGGIFLTEDVVLVTTNYRMGPIGKYSTSSHLNYYGADE